MNAYVRRTITAATAALALATAACKDGDARNARRNWTPARPSSVAGVPGAALDTAIARRLAANPPANVTAEHWEHVRRLYAAYQGSALWMEEDGPDKTRTGALLKAILDANTDAIRLDAYPLGELVERVAVVRQEKKPSAEVLADADVLLSTTYLALAEDLLSGQANPKKLSQDWYIDTKRERIDSAAALSLRADDLAEGIASMRPADEDYQELREQLRRYRVIVNAGGWQPVPKGKLLKPGEAAPAARMAALRARLQVEGYADSAATDSVGGRYDRALAGGVARFQAHHGIVVDSALGPETVESLNVPAGYRLAQIAANLERFRWLPRNFGDRYIFVNVPSFRLQAYENGQKAIDMRVIVGEEYEGRRTPVFADSMETIVFRPYWFIPPEIEEKEIRPKMAADPTYFERENLEYFTDGGKERIRQKPGGKNSLGLVKFLFPNSFNIYLHDTPQDELFSKDVRAFSHGCIRLEKPLDLAAWVLGWSPEKVKEFEQGKDNRTIKLPQKLPVYITYLTTYTRDGELYFGNDLYGRDDKLVEEIAGGSFANATAVRELDALRKLVNE